MTSGRPLIKYSKGAYKEYAVKPNTILKTETSKTRSKK
jgi:hypothetical protein